MIALVLTAWSYDPLATCGGTPTHWEGPSTWNLTRPSGQSMYSQLSDADVENAVREGFDVWRDTSSCCSGFLHDYGGTTPQYYSLNDNLNVISFEEDQWDWTLGSVNGVIAITFSQWAGGCRLTDGDQVFNGIGFDFTTSNNPGYGDTDLQSITAHENGHWVGLDHSNVNSATMWWSYNGGIGARSLHDDDEAGVCNAHPGDCGPTEDDCGDGIDDDSDGAVDCDDSDCAGFTQCMCTTDAEVGCDASITGSNVGRLNTIQSWGCANWTSSGPEAVYSFTPTQSGPVTVSMTNLQADLDLFVSPEVGGRCDGNDCQSSGGPDTSDETVTIDGIAGVTYVVVADGWEGAESSFTLSVECPGEVPPPDPDPSDGPGSADPGEAPGQDPNPGASPEAPTASPPATDGYADPGYRAMGCSSAPFRGFAFLPVRHRR